MSRLVELSLEFPIVKEETEKEQNSDLQSFKLIRELGEKESIYYYDDDLEKVILGDFCISPKCMKCQSPHAPQCEHKEDR
jgi:hypothetical protein